MRIVLISRRVFKAWCEQSLSGHSAEVDHGIGRATHDALRMAEPTKSMNYAWCSTRCDHSVAELVHETGLARRAVSSAGAFTAAAGRCGNRWPPPPRQRCRWRGRGSSLPSAATVGLVNCATWPGAGAGGRGRAAVGSEFSGGCRGVPGRGVRQPCPADSHPYTTAPTPSAATEEHRPQAHRLASQAFGHHPHRLRCDTAHARNPP